MPDHYPLHMQDPHAVQDRPYPHLATINASLLSVGECKSRVVVSIVYSAIGTHYTMLAGVAADKKSAKDKMPELVMLAPIQRHPKALGALTHLQTGCTTGPCYRISCQMCTTINNKNSNGIFSNIACWQTTASVSALKPAEQA